MALIDLSRITTNISGETQGKQVFTREDDGAYRALSQLGQGVSNIAMDLYAKQMDIFTDRESLKASQDFNLNLAKRQAYALSNIDQDSDLVMENGQSTGKTYEEYMSSFIDNEYTKQRDTLTEDMSKSKFQFNMASNITNEKTKAIFKSSEITTTNTLTRSQKKISEDSNEILYSDSLSSLDHLNQKIEEFKPYSSSVAKTSGATVSQKVTDNANKSFVESSLESSLRNMSNPNTPEAVLDFNLILGPGLMFQDFGEYKKYVMQQFQDMEPSENQAEDMMNLEAYLNAQDQNAILVKGHPATNLLSPEEKKNYLNRGLAIVFKNLKKKAADEAEQKSDWIKFPATKVPGDGRLPNLDDEKMRSVYAIRGQQIYSNSEPSQVVRDVYKMVDNRILFEAKENQVGKGKYAYLNNPKEIALKRKEWADDIINKMLGEEVGKSVKTSMIEIGSNSLNTLQSNLRNNQRKINVDLNTNPLKFKYEEPGFSARLAKAFRVTEQGIAVDKKTVQSVANELDTFYKSAGTLAAGISKGNILADKNISGMLDKLETMDSNAKLNFYKQLNDASPKVSSAFYSQAIRENKLDMNDAFIVSNLQLGDSESSDFYTKKFVEMNNKYTKPYTDELIKGFKQNVNWWTGEKSYTDLEKTVVDSASKSKYLSDLKESARASGHSEEEIKAMFSEKFLSKLTLDYMSRNEPDTSIKGYWSFKSIVGDAFNKVLKETYQKRVTPINSDSLKAVVNSSDGQLNTEELSQKSSSLAEKISQGLKNGTLRIDPKNFEGTGKMKKYEQLSPELRAKYFERDVVSGSSFDKALSLVQDFGGQKELFLRFKDKGNGNYYNLKLVGPDGKARILNLNSIKDLETMSSDEIYNKITNGLQHSKIKGK